MASEMTAPDPFAIVILLVSAALVVAVLSNRLSEWIRIPAPALFLVVATAAAAVFPVLGSLPHAIDQQIASVALIFILFDGGTRIGWTRFRTVAGAVTWLGVAGTAVTAGALALAAHFLFGFDWRLALLLGAALSPTDPAVVFSVLGKREIDGRSGTILEGESGANDPVGITLMVSLLAATGTGLDAITSGLIVFGSQLIIGAAVGLGGGWLLTRFTRHVWLPNESLYSVSAIAGAGVIFGAASVLHGSGFLAVLMAGILLGDARVPYRKQTGHFLASVASLAEIVVFVVLGFSVPLDEVLSPGVLPVGLAIAGLLMLVIRPVFVGLLVLPLRLRWGERAFVLWSGLKGAVPIVLGLFILSARVPGGERVYAIISVVVLASVAIQGGLVPGMARAFGVPMRVVGQSPRTAEESPPA
jgi:cell volume regulation protein A